MSKKTALCVIAVLCMTLLPACSKNEEEMMPLDEYNETYGKEDLMSLDEYNETYGPQEEDMLSLDEYNEVYGQKEE